MKNYLYITLLCLILFSCKEEEEVKKEDCSSDFIARYQNMGNTFVSTYRPLAGDSDQQALIDSLNNFLDAYENQSCLYNGKTLSPTQEAQDLLAQIQDVKVSSTKSTSFVSKVIYGDDDRVDIIDAVDERFKLWAGSTLAQMSPTKWNDDLLLDSTTSGEDLSLCSQEKFSEQINPARCSGFLVAPNVVVTAGHCVTSESDCANYSWVTDFVEGVDILKASQIFKCKKVLKQSVEDDSGLDYAVIELDRSILDRKYFKGQVSSQIKIGTELVVIGHPSGLPTKVADGASVLLSLIHI